MIAGLTLATILLPWFGSLAVWWAGDERPREQHGLAVVTAVGGALLSLMLLPLASDDVALMLPVGGVFGTFTLVLDGLAVLLIVIAAVVGALAVVFSVGYMRGEAQLGRYYSLILLFIGAMSGLVLSGNLLLLFFFWEITAFCSYALISFYNDDPAAVAGGMKALIVTQLGGVGLLVGALIALGTLGTDSINALLTHATSLPATSLTILAYGFLFAAAAKSAQIPFHTWLPGAMEAPTPVSALIHAATMVNAGVYLLIRFFPAFASVPGWQTAVVIVGALSALLAAVMALFATDLKRVLAYSTVSQLGYMVYAVGAGGLFAAPFHLLSHAVFKALLFLGAGAVIHSIGMRDLREMGGLGREMPGVRNAFIAGALALAGLPPLNGFWSKELVLEVGLTGGTLPAYVVMVLVSALTALYTFRMVWRVFFGERKSTAPVHHVGDAMQLPLTLLAIGALVTWLFAGPLSGLLERTLPYHAIHALSTRDLALELLTAWPTWLALGAVTVGLGTWWWRERLPSSIRRLRPIRTLATADFGFVWLNRAVVRTVRAAAEFIAPAQTGVLGWNVVGIVLGLIVAVLVLAGGE